MLSPNMMSAQVVSSPLNHSTPSLTNCAGGAASPVKACQLRYWSIPAPMTMQSALSDGLVILLPAALFGDPIIHQQLRHRQGNGAGVDQRVALAAAHKYELAVLVARILDR